MKRWMKVALGVGAHLPLVAGLPAGFMIYGAVARPDWADRGPVPLSSVAGLLGCSCSSLLLFGATLGCFASFVAMAFRSPDLGPGSKWAWVAAMALAAPIALPLFYWLRVHPATAGEVAEEPAP